MKILAFTTGLLLIAALGTFYSQRQHRAAAERDRIALAATLESLAAEKQQAEEALARNKRELQLAHSQIVGNAAQIAALNKRAAGGERDTSTVAASPERPAPLIKDEETRALMRKQRIQSVRKQVERFVGTNLAAVLNLDPEQTAQLRELVFKKHSGHAEFMAALMSGELEGEALRNAGRAVNEQVFAAGLEIQHFLGPESYAAFLDEEQAAEPRMRARMLADELRKAGAELSVDQREQFEAVMIAERRSFPFQVELGDPAKIDFENFHEHFSDANLDRYCADLQAYYGQVRERAANFLSAAQSAQLKNAQQEQLEKARITVKLTNALFAKRQRD